MERYRHIENNNKMKDLNSNKCVYHIKCTQIKQWINQKAEIGKMNKYFKFKEKFKENKGM